MAWHTLTRRSIINLDLEFRFCFGAFNLQQTQVENNLCHVGYSYILPLLLSLVCASSLLRGTRPFDTESRAREAGSNAKR
jgi:hypothetical protein